MAPAKTLTEARIARFALRCCEADLLFGGRETSDPAQ
jgi:hypothetical protein